MPSLQDFLNAANDVYGESTASAPIGYTLLSSSKLSSLENASQGFFAQAFENQTTGDIIIAYEGSIINPTDSRFNTTYGRASQLDDAEIIAGLRGQVLEDAIRFAQQVNADFGSHQIYVTGHSLGGVEAEAVAQSQSFVDGGVTFGAPGLPGYFGSGGQNFLNYVDVGDPVGNYAHDAGLAPISFTGNHFGSVLFVGPLQNAIPIIASLALLDSAEPDAIPIVLAFLATSAAFYHVVPNYTADLGLQNPSDPSQAQPNAGLPGSISVNDIKISEGNAGTEVATFTVTRVGGSVPFSVNYATADASAKVADGDYASASGTLQFGAGVSSQQISVNITGDTKFEPDETFIVKLTGATNGANIAKSQGVGDILNDDLNSNPVPVGHHSTNHDTNVMLILDNGGSMSDVLSPGVTRLDLLKATVSELLDDYANLGSVRVQVVPFSTTASVGSSEWMTITQAKALVSSLAAGGFTNYDDAVSVAESAFGDLGKLETNGVQNVSYFMSDGTPTRPIGSIGINPTEESSWTTFLSANKVDSFALGIGNGAVLSTLNPLAFDGQTNTNTNAIAVLSAAAVDATVGSSASVGNLADGYISGATIFADANGDGQFETGESSVTTDSMGNFSLFNHGIGRLIASGGLNTSTGLTFKGVMSAPADASEITPLTSLVMALHDIGAVNPEEMVRTAFGLDPSFDVANDDPVLATKNNEPAGSAAYIAGVEIMNTVTMVASALAGSGSTEDAIALTFSSLGAIVAGSNGPIHLSDETLLSSLVTVVADSFGHTLETDAASDLLKVISSQNQILESKIGQTGQTLLSDVNSIEFLSQGLISDLFQQAAGNPTSLDLIKTDFTGTNLTDVVLSAISPADTSSNHAPVLGPDDNPYIVNELPSVTNDSALDGVIGTVIFFDLDTNDTHHVVTSEAPIAVNSVLPFAIPTKTLADLDGALIAAVAEDSTHATPGQVEWLFRIPDSDLDFLGGGQSFAVTYDISVTDSQDSTSTQPITITFNGADDSPVALADSNAVGYGKSLHVNINHGVLSNDIDPDISDQGHLTVLAVDGSTTNVGHAVHGKYGWLILDANGSYSYIAEREPDFHKHHDHHVRHKHLDQRYESDGYNHHEHQHDQIHFSSSAVLQDVFTYTTSDGQGETSTATLSIVISDPDAAYQSGSHITLIGHHLKNVLDGSSGGDILIGASGSDVLIGGAGDKLSGGKGSDIFLFRPKFGTETITDFNVQQDSIQFDKSLFSSANDILNHSTNINDGVVIADAFGDKLTLVGVTTGLLHLHKGDLHLS